MINKEFSITPPFPLDLKVSVFGKPASASGNLKDDKVVILGKLFEKLYRESLQLRMGTYTGIGKAQDISTGIKSQIVIILKNVDTGTYTGTVSGQLSISTTQNEGITFITGVGYVNNGITAFTQDGFSLGSNSNLNTDNTSYLYIAVG